MPRTLPWLKDTNASKPDRKPVAPRIHVRSTIEEHAPKRRRVSTPNASDDDLDQFIPKKTTPEPNATSSPVPPSPQASDEVEPMQSGFNADDAWMMVEDEFLSTAQLFTSHLHRAEYQRLKRLAKEHEGIDPGNRPVAPGVTRQPESIFREKQAVNAQKTTRALDAIAQEAQNELKVENPHLDGLMDSPRKPARVLKGLDLSRSNTRAAAGLDRPSFSDQLAKANVNSTKVEPHIDSDDLDDQISGDISKNVPLRSESVQPKVRESYTLSKTYNERHPQPAAKLDPQLQNGNAKHERHERSVSTSIDTHLPYAAQAHVTNHLDVKQERSDMKQVFDEQDAGQMSREAQDVMARRRARLAKRTQRTDHDGDGNAVVKKEPAFEREVPTFLFQS